MSENPEDNEIEIVGDSPANEGASRQNEDQKPTDGAESPQEASGNDFVAELEKVKRDYLYLMAEFDNYKKNAIKDRSSMIKYGNERLIVQVLEVIDNFERALSVDSSEKSFEGFRSGMQMIYAELLGSLSKFGVSVSDPTGQPFNPEEHEALSSENTSEVDPGHIYRVFKKAYRLHDKLIRPAQVVVAKEPEEQPKKEDHES